MSFVGFGARYIRYDDKSQSFISGNPTDIAYEGRNSWETDPLNFLNKTKTEIEGILKKSSTPLSIVAQSTHTINYVNKSEDQVHLDDLPLYGDSGSAAWENDVNSIPTITAIASNADLLISDKKYKSENYRYQIKTNDGVLVYENIKPSTSGFGDKSKPDRYFHQIRDKIEELKAKYKEKTFEYEVLRIYDRVTRVNYADLSYPVNQEFIKNNTSN